MVSAAILHNTLQHGEPSSPPILDLELLHNYYRGGVLHLTTADGTSNLGGAYVELGFTHHYVLHSILAASALHIVFAQPHRREMLVRASAHEAAALELAKPHLSNLTKDHAAGLFIFSIFVNIYAYGSPFLMGPGETGEIDRPLDELMNCFRLSHGILALTTPYRADLSSGWTAPLMKVQYPDDSLAAGLEHRHPHLHKLRNLVLEQSKDIRAKIEEPAERLILYLIHMLLLPEEVRSPRLISAWQVQSKKGFRDLVQDRHPVALVIMAYHAVLMSMAPSLWWLSRWPRITLAHVEQLLGVDELEEFLEWPRQMMKDYEPKLSKPVADMAEQEMATMKSEPVDVRCV